MRNQVYGWVRNTSAGVDILAEGEDADLNAFLHALRESPPPLARIDTFEVEPCPPNGLSSFEIIHSEPQPGAFIPVSPDVGICDDCLRELFDPGDRRYLYPFINCTNCGPRFTIIKDIPYDRPLTTMATFEMCAFCRSEYEDPANRRFHAQPVACPECGPQVWLEGTADRRPETEDLSPITQAQELLAAGKILAIKGLGGFHLACDATNPDAVRELRRRKLRVDKPFALMMPDLATVEQHCHLSPAERELLASRQRPIVLLRRRPESNIAAEVAPNQHTLGVMLPYTPLHYLLFSYRRPETGDGKAKAFSALVMTSGNLSEEPIAYTNQEARDRLAGLADAFLMHNRDIHIRCDDSVVRVQADAIYPLRRSRGYAPDPIQLPREVPPLLAAGAELKNTFCLTRQRYAFLSHHIGDLENFETLQSFEQGIAHFERIFRIQPQAIAYDLHPDYLATRYALQRAESEGLPAYGVQHHHAHIAACMADNGLTGEEAVIGVAFDGTGYGTDGTIWGGEFLLADYRGYRRMAHLKPCPLPGGDKAARQGWRMALAWLHTAGIPWDADLPPVQHAAQQAEIVRKQIESGLNAPLTTSVGRLFDAVAALLGVRQESNYEAQAAMELEALAAADSTRPPAFTLEQDAESGAWILDPSPVLAALIADWRKGQPAPLLAARFHNALAETVSRTCQAISAQTGVRTVALSGGVWQNMFLLSSAVERMNAQGLRVLLHRQVPANDGGLSLGQAIIAAAQIT